MSCEQLHIHIDEYLDNQMSAPERAKIEQHLAECAACREYAEQCRAIGDAFAALPQQELPADFNEELQARLASAKQMPAPKKRRHRWISALAACMVFCLVVLAADFAGNGSWLSTKLASDDSGFYQQYASTHFQGGYSEEKGDYLEYEDSDSAMNSGANSLITSNLRDVPASTEKSSETSEDVERKIIRNWDVSINVTDLEQAYSAVQELAESLGGYLVSGQLYSDGSRYTSAYLSLRVNWQLAEQAVEQLAELGDMYNSHFSSDDITMAYYDVEARLLQYQAQKERLLELYAQADTIDELISVESELTRVQVEIDSLQGTLNYYANQTDTSLISISLYGAGNAQPIKSTGWDGFWQKVWSNMRTSLVRFWDALAGVFIWLLSRLPIIVLIVGAVVLLVLWIRSAGKKGRNKNKRE